MLSIEINDLLNQIGQLSKKDQKVLVTLNPARPAFPVELASELYVLPKDIYESIDKLVENSFVEWAEPETVGSAKIYGDKEVVLTDIGKKAQALTTLTLSSSSA